MQSRKDSAIETATNVTVGVAISWVITILVFRTPGGESLGIVLVYTGVSMIRSYAIRRIFAKRARLKKEGK